MSAYAGVTTNLLRSGARAGNLIVWIGGPVTNGGGASTGSKRMSSIASRDLNLTEKNYASANATVSNGLADRCHAARDDKSYDHAQVAYVVLAGGLQDPVSALATVIAKTRDTINECRKAFPAARIIWAAGPGSLAGMNDTQLTDTTTIVSAILGQARQAGAL
ncbi:SGNH/GDSL hydrolase family protein, partial [Bifidobacterium pseudolongum]